MSKTNKLLSGALFSSALLLASCFNVPTNSSPKITSEVDDWRDEVIYQVMIDRFDNGDKNNDYGLDLQAPTGWHGGDWQGVIDRLDYLKGLGVTTLWISPAVRNVEEDAGVAGYHGYWTQDFKAPNPHFGDMQKLRELVEEAHKRDMKVILDIVTNHIGQLFYYDINLNNNPDINTQGSGYCFDNGFGTDVSGNACADSDQESRLIRVTEWDPDYDPRGVQSYTSLGEAGPAPVRWVYYPEVNRVPPMPEEFQNPNWYNRKGRVVTPWGWNSDEQVETADFPGGLKDINTQRDDVRAALIDAFAWWIEETNIDGFRIDTVKHIEHEFWQVFTAGIRERTSAMGKENFLMFGEVFDGNDQKLGSYTAPGELDSVFYFSHKYQVFDDVFKRGQPTKKIEALYTQRFENYGDQPQAGGVTDAEGNGLPPTAVLVNFMDNHDVSRFLFEFNNLPALKNALFYLLTMDGIPCIYYGTEQAYNGGNDPTNREDMWRVPFNDYFVLYDQNEQVVPRRDWDEKFVPFDEAHPVYQHIKKLTGLRVEHAPLRRGSFDITWATDSVGDEADAGIIAFERTYNGETVLVVINSSESKTSQTVAVDGTKMKTSFASGTTLSDVYTSGYEASVGADGEVVIEVPARSGRILVKK